MYSKYNLVDIGNRVREKRKEIMALSSNHNARLRPASQDDIIDMLKEKCGYSISRNTISSIEQGKGGLTFEFLLNFCEIANCDIGYILGEYEEETITIHKICDITGLSESSVKKLEAWHLCEDRRRLWSKHISLIIDSDRSEKLFGNISEFLGGFNIVVEAKIKEDNSLSSQYVDYAEVKLWRASETFIRIVEEMCGK